ncbi:MAG TPA: class II aldolase/adducin family protein, partial [Acidimicrobiales bacterium]|nr:class II aldolase/adducin family protein [Acidimicrobiales bacterium]
MSDTAPARRAVLDAARALAARGLVEGTSGNVSARVDEGRVCLTPSSLRYDAMTLDDLVVVGLDGGVLEGDRSPTSEKALHLACYRRYPEIGGVIHSHPVHATMFAVAR